MNEFIVTINGTKKSITVINDEQVLIDNKKRDVKIERISENLYLLKNHKKIYEITVDKLNTDNYAFSIYGNYFEVASRTKLRETAEEFLQNKEKSSRKDKVLAPMSGMILKIIKKVGEEVKMGDPIFVLEAMKMENNINSSATGKIKQILVKENSPIEKNSVLAVIE